MSTEITKRETIKLITLDTIEPVETKWLWYPYIPAATVTTMYGRGGLGKSFLTCNLASRLSNGWAFPDGPTPACPQKVLMLSAEDDYPSVLVPRLMNEKANLANIAVPEKPFVLDPKGIDMLTEMMRDFAATVVFIDPIVYFAGGKMDINKSNEVRAMMEKLRSAATQTLSTVIIVGHIRKSQEGADGDQMTGSADWINASRSSLFVTTTNEGTKIMKHTKTNYGKLGPARSFHIDDAGFHWDETFDEDDLPMTTTRTRKDAAIAFIRSILKDGPVPATEVEKRAEDEGIPPATLNRAKIGVAESVYSKSLPGWVWQLAR